MKVDDIDKILAVLKDNFEAATKGNVFIASTVVAGLAIPISTTTAPNVVLWNPSDSGVNAELIRFNAEPVSGTPVFTSIGLSYALRAGSNVATAAIFAAFNDVAPVNGLIGRGQASKCRSSTAQTNTLTAAGTWFYSMFHEYAGVAASAITPTGLDHTFNGALVVPPGVAIWVTGAAASSALLAQTLVWKETPA